MRSMKITTKVVMVVSLFFGSLTCFAADTVDPELLSAMEWRLVGPFRGGRVTTVAGVPDKPQLYYMGATAGTQRVIKGSNYLSANWTELRASFREPIDPNEARPDIGFRIGRYIN